jgi:phosphatidylglycerophosphate synthase
MCAVDVATVAWVVSVLVLIVVNFHAYWAWFAVGGGRRFMSTSFRTWRRLFTHRHADPRVEALRRRAVLTFASLLGTMVGGLGVVVVIDAWWPCV